MESHPTWLELDRAALAHNLGQIRARLAGNVKIIASVKANGYGHGVVPVARVLAGEGVDMLATGSFAEALAVRGAGVETPILMLAGALPDAMGEIVAQGFIPTIFDLDGARAVSRAGPPSTPNPMSAPAPVFVKVDCGLGRVGVALDEAQGLIAQISRMANIVVQGLYTHLSFNDALGMAYAKERLALFYALVQSLKAAGIDIPITQALASSALLLDWRDDCTAVCPGHILFGLNPVTADLAGIAPFQPALGAIKSRVIQIRDHSGGPDRGAGGYHRERRQRRTAVAPCGLNDGYAPITRGMDGVVLHGAHELRVIGVSLEHLTVEVPNGVEIAVGDELLITGGDGPVALHRVAQWQGRRPIDTIMGFSAHMPVHVV
jgi:alanine racemase